MKKVGIILGSTREGRQGEKVAQWFLNQAKQNKEVEFELVDLRDWDLPFFNFPISPAYAPAYDPGMQTKWGEKIASFDGFVLVTPEYNHSFPAVLKNALDFVFKEWNNKPVSFVSYSAGPFGGIRAIEHLIPVVVELKMIPVREQISITSIFDAFDENGQLKNPTYAKSVDTIVQKLSSLMK